MTNLRCVADVVKINNGEVTIRLAGHSPLGWIELGLGITIIWAHQVHILICDIFEVLLGSCQDFFELLALLNCLLKFLCSPLFKVSLIERWWVHRGTCLLLLTH